MEQASRLVLNGFTVRTDVAVVRYPDRYMDKRGKEFWGIIMGLWEEIETQIDPVTRTADVADPLQTDNQSIYV
jgi:DNA polymerase-1